LLSTLLLLFATLATVLAAGGIYGSVLYQARQRTREMGLRLALGAGPGRILRLVVGGAALLTLLGVLLGLGGAWALRKTLESAAYGISGTHFPTLLGAAVLVGTVATAASYAAARRAMVTDLASVLRED
jgi:ABC-type antimicrobial peptide transport system permease subunit